MAISPRLATSTLRNIRLPPARFVTRVAARYPDCRAGAGFPAPRHNADQCRVVVVVGDGGRVGTVPVREQSPPIGRVERPDSFVRVGDHLGGRPGYTRCT